MRFDKEKIFRKAGSLGNFQPDFLEKSLRLLDVLREVRKHPVLKDRLVLKGGTAINFIQSKLPRLSVDIDFNCMGPTEREKMQPIRNDVVAAFEHVATAMGYDLKQVVNEPAAIVHNLYFTNIYDRRDHIQVDINFLNRVSLFGEEKVSITTFIGEPSIRILTLTIEELYGGKIKALLERAAPRDLYDVYNFMESNTGYSEVRLHQALLVFGMTISDDFRKYDSKRIDPIPDKSFFSELYPTLRKQERPKKKEMIHRVKPFLDKLLKFTEQEKNFMDRFYEGEINAAEIAFSGEFLERVKGHPALQWQLLKIKRKK